MELPVEILQNLNVPNLVAIAAMLWFMHSRLDRKFDKIDDRFEKIENDISEIKNEISKLKNDMIEVKTILRFKECCMINDERQMKKAE